MCVCVCVRCSVGNLQQLSPFQLNFNKHSLSLRLFCRSHTDPVCTFSVSALQHSDVQFSKLDFLSLENVVALSFWGSRPECVYGVAHPRTHSLTHALTHSFKWLENEWTSMWILEVESALGHSGGGPYNAFKKPWRSLSLKRYPSTHCIQRALQTKTFSTTCDFVQYGIDRARSSSTQSSHVTHPLAIWANRWGKCLTPAGVCVWVHVSVDVKGGGRREGGREGEREREREREREYLLRCVCVCVWVHSC